MGWPGQSDWNQQGGYGPPAGQSTYPPPGQTPPPAPAFPPPGSGGSGAGPVIAIVLTILLVVLGGLGLAGYFLFKKAAEETNKAVDRLRTYSPPPAVTAPVLPPPATSDGSGSVPTTAPPSVPPRITGWHGVPSMNHGLAYDVPPSWEVSNTSTIVGFEDDSGRPLVGMSGAAGVEEGTCTLVRSGVSGGGGIDVTSTPDIPALSALARSTATRWANAGYTPDNGSAPTIRLSPPQTVNVSGGKGVHVAAELTLNGSRGKCDPPRAVVHTVAMKSTSGAPVTFIVFADRDVPRAIADADLRKILTTLRRI